ncbi:hypothetical protein FRC16_003744 [Serendipita sp. 398]|nr:hypothetical protein FRC16_003744 [Serendipita sp. 398]
MFRLRRPQLGWALLQRRSSTLAAHLAQRRVSLEAPSLGFATAQALIKSSQAKRDIAQDTKLSTLEKWVFLLLAFILFS